MKIYLAEAFNPEIKFDNDSSIIALTPLACYQLDKAGVKYSIIEDFYNAVEFSQHIEEYRISIFKWIDEFDDFLQKNINGLDLKLAAIYRWYLKGTVLDPVYLRSYELRQLYNKLIPTAVTYLTPKPADPPPENNPELYHGSLYSHIIPIICNERSIPLNTITLDRAVKETLKKAPAVQNATPIIRLKKTMYKNDFIRRSFFFSRYLNSLLNSPKTRQKMLNIFFTTITHIGEDFIAEALTRGHRIYLLTGDTIFKYSLFGTRKYSNIKTDDSGKNKGYWENAARLLEGSDLVRWVNEKCQLDVTVTVLPKLQHFISTTCPQLMGYYSEFVKFFTKINADVFLAPYVLTLQDHAALLAAKVSPQIKTACLVHGEGVYQTRAWSINELQNYNIQISSNTELKDYYQHLADEIHSPTKIYSNSHRIRKIQKIAVQREKQGTKLIRKNRIIYLPTIIAGDRRRYEGDAYSDTWYYEFQKSIIEFFNTRKEYSFIWKGFLQNIPIYNPIPDFIKDNYYSNVTIATNPFVEHLLTADRVICDYPSTGFYESVTAGVPTMSLYHDSLLVRDGAIKYFGNLVKKFSDTAEAIKHINEFLNNDPEHYKMKIDVEKGSLFDILEGTTNKPNSQ